MTDIKPPDGDLLTDRDVDYALFRCCGDEDLIFLRCPKCGHIWVECYECSTWYVDLDDLSRQESPDGSEPGERCSCPSCRVPFADDRYLSTTGVDRYFPTADEVIAAGFHRYLAKHLRDQVVDTVASYPSFESIVADKGPPARWSSDDVIRFPRVMSVFEANLDRLVDELRGAGWCVFRLPAGIRDATAFCDALRDLVPLAPSFEYRNEIVWDALADSLSGGLGEEVDSDRIAIVWPTPRDGASPELEEAMSVLWQVAHSSSKPELTQDRPRQVLVLTTGHVAIRWYDD